MLSLLRDPDEVTGIPWRGVEAERRRQCHHEGRPIRAASGSGETAGRREEPDPELRCACPVRDEREPEALDARRIVFGAFVAELEAEEDEVTEELPECLVVGRLARGRRRCSGDLALRPIGREASVDSCAPTRCVFGQRVVIERCGHDTRDGGHEVPLSL